MVASRILADKASLSFNINAWMDTGVENQISRDIKQRTDEVLWVKASSSIGLEGLLSSQPVHLSLLNYLP